MIDFKPFSLSERAFYEEYLQNCGQRGCEYSFVNLYLWGRQNGIVQDNRLLFFSRFNQKSVYLFPIGNGDLKQAIDSILCDAAQRGIDCCITGLLQEDCAQLETLFPNCFHFYCDRSSFDYVYDIAALASLKGRKFQKKRNHLNRFRQEHPNSFVTPITTDNLSLVKTFVNDWYASRLAENPHADYHMERTALEKALNQWQDLHLEGLILLDNGIPLAITIGSRLSENTFDVHFEKALEMADGAYAAINQAFAAYLQERYPSLRWLNREDDMGLEGLRKAKLSYSPDFMIEKYWCCPID